MTSSPGQATQARDYACRWGLSNEGVTSATIIPRRPGDTPEHWPGEGPSPNYRVVFIPDPSRATVRSPSPGSTPPGMPSTWAAWADVEERAPLQGAFSPLYLPRPAMAYQR